MGKIMGTVVDLKGLVSNNTPPSKPASLSEEAASDLREMILLEKLPAGTALTERDLSNALGISRTPMREAIRILANEGLVEFSASRRPRVADPSIGEITDYLRIQGALEALSGELACVLASDEDLENIKFLNEQMINRNGKDDPVTAFNRDMEFHKAIVAASRNAPLAMTHASYNARLWRSRFMSSQRKVSRDSTTAEHAQIVEALMRRDEHGTAEALKHHLATAVVNIKKALRERDELKSKKDIK
jgi:DNA-binding GntR family transcriptional regulator